MATDETLKCCDLTDSKNVASSSIAQDTEDPIVINPDINKHPESDSESDIEYSDALDTKQDELSDIKRDLKKAERLRHAAGYKDSCHLEDDTDDYFKDAEGSEPEIDEPQDHAPERDLKEDELKKRQDAEDRLTDSERQVGR